ncbi:asparagine synthase (glutamine-hydrolyzing) [Vulgatibacter incomptus]|uniref:asparagine synthase (glutamine-hydrolyzing) n=1 Tax=Vulgatibacter incomptus TaxID=1391653 RepID=A0A0K1P8K8_9BACT|nr:asparagine synthase (glutamine-hydrolyzing) [Vulgatibacter incomptus]AKU89855.1 Asparagine synthetase [Vulgatibacter incomptus]
MCGIAGFALPIAPSPDERAAFAARLRRMVASLRHRGPDALNGLVLPGIALGHARLSIVDPAGGHQPMRDAGTGVTLVFNGEIFNHPELREALAPGYRFRTASDTEVLLAAFLEHGIDCVDELNGQFAFAIHDPRDGSLWLGRDRFGKLPLFYVHDRDCFAFASEAKALFAGDVVRPRLDARALFETLHLWGPSEARSAFDGVRSLPPGCVARVRGGELTIRRYWELDLADERIDHGLTLDRAADEVEELLEDAVRLRLRADVPVAAYLSGGLDSSLLCAIAQDQLGGTLQTFSVAFAHERYDERAFQAGVAAALETEHHSIAVEAPDIGALLPQVVEHAEATLLRTAPAPLLKLSGLVRDHGTKVVLTGEGADEVFLGYDLFKETRIRQFWARRPESSVRPLLFGRLYPYLDVSRQSPQLLRQFFGIGLDEPGALDFSHRVRWTNSGRIARFLSPAFREHLEGWDPVAELLGSLPARIREWRPLARAQFLEIRTLLSQYLLSSQGDRMLMASSVEGRFPFLDHRLAELSARLPDSFKLGGLKEKLVLRRIARGRVPAQVTARTKFPYRAPIAEALTGPRAPTWARELLGRDAVDSLGIFDGSKVERFLARLAARAQAPSDADDMVLAAVASTQLLAHRFLGEREIPRAQADSVKVCFA